MTKTRSGVQWLIGTLKGDRSYRLEGDYGTRDLLEIMVRRGREALRGVFFARHVARVEFPIFCGRRITVRHGRHVRIGRAAILGDDVLIDALSRKGLRIGRNVTIGRGSTIACTGVLARPGEGISIGDRVGISEYAHLGGQGGIEIGNDVIFGPGVHVFSENHRFSETSRPIRDQGEERAAVVIEDDCWIGAGATILAGVRIGTGSVVGSRAVVIADVPPRSVVVGVPARLVSTRKDEP